MRPLETIAVELLQSSISWEPDARLVGNVTAMELALVAAFIITSCPVCGAEPWVNIDCQLCNVISSIELCCEANASEEEG